MRGVSLADWIAHHAECHPGRDALVWQDERIDWAELHARVHKLALGLAAAGISSGDRVAAVLRNRPESISLFGACAKLGAVYSPLNPKFGDRELEAALEDADPRVLVVGPDMGDEGASGGTDVEIRVELGEDCDPTVGGLAETGSGSILSVDAGLEDPALLLFTSGTTGRPRGVAHTWRTLLWNHRQFIDELRLSPDDRNYCAAPLAHVAGSNVLTGPMLYLGGTTTLAEEFEPERMLETLREERCTVTFLVPAMWRRLFEAADGPGAFGSLRFGIVGGAPVSAELIERARELGVTLVQGYGMTEAGPMVSLLSSEDPDEHVRSVGRPGMHVETRVVTEEGDKSAAGEAGELWVRGPNIVDEYWRAPEATRESFRGDWFRTGDLVRKTADGELELVGRIDDMIITGGENVYPREIEVRLAEMEGVAEAGVVGTDHPEWGEAVTAVVVPESGEGAPRLEVIREELRSELADYKAPHRLALVDEIPKNPTGKIRRDALRAHLASDDVHVSEYHYDDRTG
jgi:fatty-acyl-CoA synthase